MLTRTRPPPAAPNDRARRAGTLRSFSSPADGGRTGTRYRFSGPRVTGPGDPRGPRPAGRLPRGRPTVVGRRRHRGEATPGPTGEALGRVAARFRLGHLGAQAWEAADGHPGWAEVGREMARAERSGISLAPTLRDLAEDARREAADQALASARKVGVRSVVPLMVCFLPAFVLVGVVPIIAGLLAGLVG
ncbi:type II secretion system F family protein [Tessaracoccus palaemonis]|uniref:type II secretion system F family protein n=1 Tax=Tessaracoccus palaemonis TaxID=2829499 RepID=UPI0021029CAB|nr:type II secretion system F family protein [Tessaracoccus palaemonis]